MYHYPNGSELNRLGTQHQVSLDKHQRMIHANLEWQRISRLKGEQPKPETIPVGPLHLVWAAIIALLIRR